MPILQIGDKGAIPLLSVTNINIKTRNQVIYLWIKWVKSMYF